MVRKIIIGARGSALSLKQTEIVKDKLLLLNPKLAIEIKVISTKGDKDMKPIPLDSMGKGWFTKEIDDALLKGTIDLAVHSLKDLPEELPTGLILASIPEREAAGEVLVSKNNLKLEQLPKGAVIGTDSSRRQAQLLHKRPDLVIKSMRGNVPTRLKKLHEQEYDAVILAAAGLKRLGLQNNATQNFSVTDFIPSPGQGALAVVVKETNKEILSLVKKINDTANATAVKAERAFSEAIGGGCKMPVGAYADCSGNALTLYGMVGSTDGKQLAKDSLKGDITKAAELGKKLAKKLLKQTASWYRPYLEKVIVITRPAAENKTFKTKLENEGFSVYEYASIKTVENKLTEEAEKALANLEIYDWIIFTSVKGVRFFMEYLKRHNINSAVLKRKIIGAVGPRTADELKKHKLPVTFIPTTFTTQDLATEIKGVKGKKILLPRSSIASKLLTKMLIKKGATVTDIPIYKTEYPQASNTEFSALVLQDKIRCITFTSPSTVKGFIKNITDEKIQRNLLHMPILAIGPVTAKAAQKAGFAHIRMANPHTTEGMITKLKEGNL